MSKQASTFLQRLHPAPPRSWRLFRRDERGVASIEMAFVFPVMLLLYFGLVDTTSLLSASRRVTLTASTLADLTTQAPGTVTKADLDGFFDAANAIMEPFPADQIALEVYGFTKDGANVKLAWKYKNGGASCASEPSADSQMKALMTEGNDVVVSQVCFKWTPITGKIFGADPMTLDDKLVLRPRQSSTITCTNCG